MEKLLCQILPIAPNYYEILKPFSFKDSEKLDDALYFGVGRVLDFTELDGVTL